MRSHPVVSSGPDSSTRIGNSEAMEHSGHDYERLRRRWVELASRCGLRGRVLFEEVDFPVLVFENELSASGKQGGVYLSAGVHGDECAPVWALLQWAESEPSVFTGQPVVIFPCLNPHGLLENTRRDQNGVDLNRRFQDDAYPIIAAWTEYLKGRRFDFAVNLHEDYDATGIYLYEVTRGDSIGDSLLSQCDAIIPREKGSEVDGSTFENGLLSHTGDIEELVEEKLEGGYPEALHLFLHYSRDSFTFETPSETELLTRIDAQRAFIEAVMKAYWPDDVAPNCPSF